MAKNNVHVLTAAELAAGKNYYVFSVKSDMLICKPANYNRMTIKSLTEPFTVIYKCEGKSVRVTISPEAIKLWREKFGNFHLLDVQNAINKLFIMYQDINEDDVKAILTDPDCVKIKKVI